MRRPSRNCPTIICAQAPSRPEGRAQRGRSAAQRLARCRAQMQHRCRDGRRGDATARCAHLTTASRHRIRRARATMFRDSNWPGSTRERDQFAGNIFRTNGTGSSGRSESPSSAFDAANTRRFSPPNMLCPTTSSDSDSDGVSDPSGQARGHVGRAQRGRSRHGSSSDCHRDARQRAAKSAARITDCRADDADVSEHERNAAAAQRAGNDARQRRRDAGLSDPGDDLISGGRPRGRPHL
jgi:hypothetical protein